MTDLDGQLAAAPDATTRAALLGLDLEAFRHTSSRLKAALVVITILSALTVIGLGVLVFGIPFDDGVAALAAGMAIGLVPFAVGMTISSLLAVRLAPRLGLRRVSVLAGGVSSGIASLLIVLAATFVLPLGEVVELGLAAGVAVGSAIGALSIAALPSAFRRPNANLATTFEQMRSLPTHKTTFDGRIAPIVADHAVGQFLFIALVPIAVASAGFAALFALLVAGVCALATDLDFRGRAMPSMIVTIAAAVVLFAAAIVSAT